MLAYGSVQLIFHLMVFQLCAACLWTAGLQPILKQVSDGTMY